MKGIRRMISFLLALVMVIGMVPPMAVSAEETEPAQSVTEAMEETTAPTETVTESVEETTMPTERPADPMEETTVPTEAVTESVDETTVPTETATETTEETTAPTEAVAETSAPTESAAVSEEAEIPEPVLTYRRVVCSEDDLWGLENWDETANGGLYGEDDLTFVPGEYWLAFYLNTWDPESGSWEHTPVHVEFGEYLTGDLMEEGEYAFCEGEEDTEYYYRMAVKEVESNMSTSIAVMNNGDKLVLKVQINQGNITIEFEIDNISSCAKSNAVTTSVSNSNVLKYSQLLLDINWENIRNVGKQAPGSSSCSCYALAYARTLLDKKVHKFSEYNDFGNDEYTVNCNWDNGQYSGFFPEDFKKKEVYQRMYSELCNGKPVIARVNSASSEPNPDVVNDKIQHYVTVVGFENVNSLDSLSASNFLILDPGKAGHEVLNMSKAGYDILLKTSRDNSNIKEYQLEYDGSDAVVSFQATDFGYISKCKGFFPSYGKIKISKTPTTNVKSLPCSKDTDPESITLESPETGEEYTVYQLIYNDQNRYWYKVKTKENPEEFGYIFAGDTTWVAQIINDPQDVTVTDVKAPTTIEQGNSFYLEGNIKANYSGLHSVAALVYPGNTTVGNHSTGTTIQLPDCTYTYPIAKSDLDDAVSFGSLPVGDYTYVIKAWIVSYVSKDGLSKEQRTPYMQLLHQSQFSVTKAYTISLYTNGASDGNSSFTVVQGNAIGELPKPSFDGMRFEGWFTEPFGGTQVTASTVPTGDMTLYAHYTYNYGSRTKLEFDTNGGSLPGAVNSATVNGINWPGRPADTLLVYNVAGGSTGYNYYGTEVAVNSAGAVVDIRLYESDRQLTVPEGGFILSGHGKGSDFVGSITKLSNPYVSFNYETGKVQVFDSHAGYLAATKMCGGYTRYGELPVPSRSGYVFNGWTVDGYDASYYSSYGGWQLKANWAEEDEIYPADEMIYNGHLYERYDSNVSWTKAKQLCEAKGGHLVTITDAAEQSAVAAFAAKGKRGIYRIGATDESSEGTWRWVTGETFSYNNWDKSTPEPSNGAGENYANIVAVELALHNKAVGEWFDDADVKHTRTSDYYDLSNTGFICEYEYESACNHTYTWTVTKNPTTTTTGTIRQKCTACGKATDSVLPVLNGNDYGYYVSQVPTCAKTGTGVYLWVVENGDGFEFEIVLPKKEHIYSGKYTEASCSAYGYTTYTCSGCGDSYVVYDEQGWSEWSTTYPSNASQIESRTEYRYQDKETTTSTTQSTMSGWTLYNTTSAWGPYGAWSEWGSSVITANDSTKVESRTVYGYYYYLCSACGDHMHGYGTCYTWAGGCGATTTNDGWHSVWSPISWDDANLKDWYGTGKYYTNLNGEVVFKWDDGGTSTQYRSCTRQMVDTYHFYRWTDWSDWSDTVYTSNDNRKVETRTVYRYLKELPGHTYSYKVTKSPTTAAAGTLTGTCGVCSITMSVTLPKLNTADYTYKVTKAATCKATGTARYTWNTTTYGSFYFDVTLPKTDHSYTSKVTTPTCTEQGYTTHTCSGCGDSYIDSYVNALGHNYEEGFCTRCGAKDPDYVETITGTCGENLTWTLDKDGTLTISGTGEMTTFSNSDQAWAEYMDEIRHLVVEDGATSISKYAFYECSALETVQIPDTVLDIGAWAFAYCTNLTDAYIGDGVTVIDGYVFSNCSALKDISLGSQIVRIMGRAFENCASLKNIAFPDTLTRIDAYAFTKCTSLETVMLPAAVNNLSYGIFSGCSKLKEINVVEDNATYCSVDGVVYRESMLTIIAVPNAWEGSFVVPEGVWYIGEHAFSDCSAITEVILPDSISQIYSNAFARCTGLTRIIIPESVKTIETSAFLSCSNLTEIKFLGNAPAFRVNVFKNVTATAYYPKNNTTWTASVMQDYGGIITWVAYAPCEDGHTYVDVKTEATCTERGYTIHTCSACGDSYVDTYVDALGHSWDAGEIVEEPTCTTEGMKTVSCLVCFETKTETIPTTEHNYKSAITEPTCTEEGVNALVCDCGECYYAYPIDPLGHDYQYGTCTRCGETDPDYVETISGTCGENLTWTLDKDGTLTISGTGAMTEFNTEFNDDYSDIPWYTYRDQIAKIEIESGVTTIGQYAFVGCSNAAEILLPETMTKIGRHSFSECSALEEIHIPASVTSIETSAFSGCSSLQGIWVDENNTMFASDNAGVLFNKEVTELLRAPGAIQEYSIPDTVSRIGPSAFDHCRSLKSITIPSSVSQIGITAFYGCRSLETVDISDLTAWCKIDFVWNGANPTEFSKKLSLNGELITHLEIPSGITAIQDYAFSYIECITSVVIPDTVTSIGEDAFVGCINLETMKMSEKITKISMRAFRGCQSLSAVEIPDGVETIGYEAFAHCTALETVTIGKAGTFYQEIFEYCSNLKEIIFTSDAPTFGENMFLNVTAEAKYPAENATWTEDVMQNYGGTITWVPYCTVENRITVNATDLSGQTSLWVDGKEYAVQTNGDTCYVDLPDGNAKTMVSYTYHVGNSSDIHTQYPISMKVWTLKNKDGIYTATRVEELDNILQYSGTSIRVTGKQGIRMITSIEKDKKNFLISDGLAGYTLKEYGTVVAWASQLDDSNPLVLGQPYVMSNHAYKKGIADPVFAYDSNLMQYTNVLVGFSLDQCKDDLSMRPYMILLDAEGNEIRLYGGVVTRSIGYIALQNKDYFAVGTEAYDYVWDIIRHVYGEDYVPQAA